MQAGNASAALLRQASPQGGRAPTAPPPDLFQVCLQGRLVSHLQAGQELAAGQSPGSLVKDGMLRSAPSPPGAAAPGIGAPRPLFRGGVRQTSGSTATQLAAMVIPPQFLPELAVRLMEAGAPAPQVQEWLAQPRFQAQGVSLAEVQEFLQAGLGPGTGAGGGAPTLSAAAGLPPQIAELVSLMARQPGSGLKISQERQPELASLLLSAGLPPQKVERLLTHPGAQETGLTPEQLRAAWQDRSSAANSGQQPGLRSPKEPLGDFWDKLRLPAEAVPELKLALQKLGVPPEALAALGAGTDASGVSLGQAWQLLREAHLSRTSQTAPEGLVTALADALAAGAPQDAEAWRQLLLKTGMAPAAVDALWGGTTPGTQGELRARLLELAPQEAQPEAQESPKPVYLPRSLRLTGWVWQGKEDSGAQADGREPWPQATPESPVPSSPGPGTQESSFTAFLAGSPALTPGGSLSPAVGGTTLTALPPVPGQSVWSQLQEAVVTNLKPGQTQLTLTLNPPELGQVALTLSLEGQHLMVAAVTGRPEVAHLAQAQVEQLVRALSQQGIILTQFSVQAQEAPRWLTGSASLGTRPVGRKPEVGLESPVGKSRATRGVDCFA